MHAGRRRAAAFGGGVKARRRAAIRGMAGGFDSEGFAVSRDGAGLLIIGLAALLGRDRDGSAGLRR